MDGQAETPNGSSWIHDSDARVNGRHPAHRSDASSPVEGSAREKAPAGGQTQTPAWSIIVITRNEEANVEACLGSVLESFAGRSFEIVLVDSASTDRTVELARRHPVRVVSLPPSPRLNPAVGRHFGLQHARGRYLLFLDGDCTLLPRWVAEAERALDDEPDLGGVAGASYGLLTPAADGTPRYQDEYPTADYDSPPYLAGSAAYKREVIDKAGGFNPNLFSCEEEEIGARVRKAGYRMRRLRMQMSQHHPRHGKESVSELFRRLRRRYFIGLGQLARYTFSQGLPIERPLAPISRHLVFFGLMTAGVLAALVSLATADATAIAAWAISMTVLFALFAFKARELRKPAYYFLEWAVASPAVVYGMLLPTFGPDRLHATLEPIAVYEPAERPGSAAGNGSHGRPG